MNIVQDIEKKIAYQRNNLANRCDQLAIDMNQLCKKLKGNIEAQHLCINDLGEIQAKGTIIDAECGKLGSLIEMYKLIKDQSLDAPNSYCPFCSRELK